MCFRTRTVEIADNRSHTSLVSKGGSEVDWLLGVILRESMLRELTVSNGEIWRFLEFVEIGTLRQGFEIGKEIDTDDLTFPR